MLRVQVLVILLALFVAIALAVPTDKKQRVVDKVGSSV
jgi:hypothetical protein